MLGGARAQGMQSAMHVRVVVFVVTSDGVEQGRRFLRSGRAVEVNQGVTVHALAQDREIFSQRRPIHSALHCLVHEIICANNRAAPVYSQPHQHRQLRGKCLTIRAVAVRLPSNEENGDGLLAASGKAGTRVVLRSDPNSTKRISRTEFRTARDAFCYDERSTTCEQSSAANSVATDSPGGPRRRSLAEVHKDIVCAVQIEFCASKTRDRTRSRHIIFTKVAS